MFSFRRFYLWNSARCENPDFCHSAALLYIASSPYDHRCYFVRSFHMFFKLHIRLIDDPGAFQVIFFLKFSPLPMFFNLKPACCQTLFLYFCVYYLPHYALLPIASTLRVLNDLKTVLITSACLILFIISKKTFLTRRN